MTFEVQKKHARGWRNLGSVNAVDSAKAAGIMGYAHGPGTYRVRPDGSLDTFFRYNVAVPRLV